MGRSMPRNGLVAVAIMLNASAEPRNFSLPELTQAWRLAPGVSQRRTCTATGGCAGMEPGIAIHGLCALPVRTAARARRHIASFGQ